MNPEDDYEETTHDIYVVEVLKDESDIDSVF